MTGQFKNCFPSIPGRWAEIFLDRDMRVKVKICGIQDVHTALEAAKAGADALGFIFVPESKRYVKPQLAREIISSLPPGVDAVGVFVNTPTSEINQIAAYCNLDIIQLHGKEKTGDYSDLSRQVIKCIKVKSKLNVTQIDTIKADAVLLDTYHPQMAGGTGKTFDWNIAGKIKTTKPIILAGGLNPNNVMEAIKTVKPFAVDVSSGVETGGVKDISKIREFIKKAKEVFL